MAGDAPLNAELSQNIRLLSTIVTKIAQAKANNPVPPIAAAPPAANVALSISPGVDTVKDLINYMSEHQNRLCE